MPEGRQSAVIIAGGQGTRIRSISGEERPKALVPVAGKPILQRIMEVLAREGFGHVVLMAGHLAEVLEAEAPPMAKILGLSLDFVAEGEPLGTAGNLPAAAHLLPEDFLVVYGDVVFDMDLGAMMAYRRSRRAMAAICCHPNDHPHESDLLITDDDDRVLEISRPKGRAPAWRRNLVPAAIYALHKSAMEHIRPGQKQDFIKDVFPAMIAADARIWAYNTPEYLRDMGTPQRYEMAERDIAAGLPRAMNLREKRPAVFFDRDGVLNPDREPRGVCRTDDLELLPGAARAVRLVNEAGLLAVLITNQPHLAKGFMGADDLRRVHNKLETLLGHEGARLDRIYHCPHHPEAGHHGEVPELKIACDCRKPEPGMILRAARELPVDLGRSCVIGDSARDIGAARRAGLRAYGVRTGVGCQGCEGPLRPDLIFDNALDAARFVARGVPQAEELAARIAARRHAGAKPVVVGVCGLARSGKSTFCHALALALKEHGLPSLHLRLDDWIVPKSRRRPGAPSQERNQTAIYTELLDNLRNGRRITASGYSAQTRESEAPAQYSLGDAAVLILDGLYACHGTIAPALDHKIMIRAERELLRRRFIAFYRWKGDNDSDSEALWNQRVVEEHPEVLAANAVPDLILELD